MRVEHDYTTGVVALSEIESWINAKSSEVFKWVNIVGVKPYTYIVSSYGKLYQSKLKMEVKTNIRNGYKTSMLVDENGNTQEHRIDEIVARLFIKNYEKIMKENPHLHIRHMNGVIIYNYIENLELLP